MSKLNRDIIYLILQELQDDKITLHSCLSVNKIWCETIIPILWKDPWKDLKGKEKLLVSVIISHLPNKSRDNLSKHMDFSLNSYPRPLFDYISFCRHLNLNEIERMIIHSFHEKSKISII